MKNEFPIGYEQFYTKATNLDFHWAIWSERREKPRGAEFGMTMEEIWVIDLEVTENYWTKKYWMVHFFLGLYSPWLSSKCYYWNNYNKCGSPHWHGNGMCLSQTILQCFHFFFFLDLKSGSISSSIKVPSIPLQMKLIIWWKTVYKVIIIDHNQCQPRFSNILSSMRKKKSKIKFISFLKSQFFYQITFLFS